MIEPMEKLPDPPCEVCHKHPEDCRCPECPTCGNQGCPGCTPTGDPQPGPAKKRSTKEALILIAEEAEACIQVMGPHGELVRGVQLDVYRRVSELARTALADLAAPQGEPSPAPAGDLRQWAEMVRDSRCHQGKGGKGWQIDGEEAVLVRSDYLRVLLDKVLAAPATPSPVQAQAADLPLWATGQFTHESAFYNMLMAWTPEQCREFYAMLSRRPDFNSEAGKAGEGYRLLVVGDVVEATDEVYAYGKGPWGPVNDWTVGKAFIKVYNPMRRRINASTALAGAPSAGWPMTWTAGVLHVLEWQGNERIHPMTCGNDSNHANLIPAVTQSGRVILACLDCAYRQKWVPGFPQYEAKAESGERSEPAPTDKESLVVVPNPILERSDTAPTMDNDMLAIFLEMRNIFAPHEHRLRLAMRNWVKTRTPNELIDLIESNAAPIREAKADPGPTDEDLKPYGWAPGSYECSCRDCWQDHVADKRANYCRPCATKSWRRAQGKEGAACGDTINKFGLGDGPIPGARTCADDPKASIWQDAEYACPSIKRKYPAVAPHIRRLHLANLFGRIESVSRNAREALEDESRRPGLENIVYELENQLKRVKAKTQYPRRPLCLPAEGPVSPKDEPEQDHSKSPQTNPHKGNP